jgi:hypothetical protein
LLILRYEIYPSQKAAPGNANLLFARLCKCHRLKKLSQATSSSETQKEESSTCESEEEPISDIIG